jgi:dihydrofolate reductase
VVISLDGYIAGPNGEADWITLNPEIDFNEIFQRYDTALVGRRTYETMIRSKMGMPPGIQTYVFSRTLSPTEHPKVTTVSMGAAEVVTQLKEKPGKDIWLFGGGVLFRSLAQAHLVDEIEVAVFPILLGAGLPLLPPPADRFQLALESHHIYKCGIVSLTYSLR